MEALHPQGTAPLSLSTPRAIAIVHTDQSCTGAVGVMLQQRFEDVLVVRPGCGDLLPDVESIQGPVVVFGGPMGVHDACRLEWLALELDWIGRCLTRRVRMLGICLGAQLIAKSTGHGIVSCARGELECGYYPIQPEADAEMPSWVYQWHRNGVFPSLSAEHPMRVLARSRWAGGAAQAFVVGSAMGLQFHPEVSSATISRWITRDPDDLARPGSQPADEHLVSHSLHMASMQEWVDGYLATWLGSPSDPKR